MNSDHALAIRELLTSSPRSALRHASDGLAPRAGGELPNSSLGRTLVSQIATVHCQAALVLAPAYLEHLREEMGFSNGFVLCIAHWKCTLQQAKSQFGCWGDFWAYCDD